MQPAHTLTTSSYQAWLLSCVQDPEYTLAMAALTGVGHNCDNSLQTLSLAVRWPGRGHGRLDTVRELVIVSYSPS
jgi:hypothetical protein